MLSNPLQSYSDILGYADDLHQHLLVLYDRIWKDLGPGETERELWMAVLLTRQFRKIVISEWAEFLDENVYAVPMSDTGWPAGSEGDVANSPAEQHPALSTGQFTPDKSAGKDLDVHEHANRVNRLVSTYLAASPEQRHGGATWYGGAHRAAVTVASGRDPGIIPQGARSTPSIKQGVYRPPNVSADDVNRAAGVIARLSPSMPAGMDWEHNPRAAHELYRMTPKQRERASQGGAEGAAGRRVNGNRALQHSGGAHVANATEILEGRETPEQNLNQTIGRRGDRRDTRKKAGSFMRNITDPAHSSEVTVDARSAGIAGHHRVKFDEVSQTYGKLEGQRYHDFEGAHQEATQIVNQHLAAAGHSPILPHQLQATTWVADKQGQEFGQGNMSKGGGRKNFRMPFGQEKTG